jgi:hypothetical protein
MRRSLWFCRISLACSLIVVSASTAQSQFYDPFGVQNKYKPFGEYGPTFQYTSPTKVWNVLNGHSNNQPGGRVAQRVAPSQAVRLDDLNLSVSTPSGPWIKVDQKTGSPSRYILSRKNPTIILSLAGEQLDTEAHGTDITLLAESQTNIRKLGGTVGPGEQTLSAGSVDGVAYSATVIEGEFATYYAMWVAVHNGYKYQLAVYGDKRDKAMIDAAIHNFVHGIQFIQPTAVADHNRQKTTMTR